MSAICSHPPAIGLLPNPIPSQREPKGPCGLSKIRERELVVPKSSAAVPGDRFSGGCRNGRWAWSSVFADIDNDGWDDLLIANGYLTTEDTGDL